MKQQLDTLVWIGAGSAESPADLISLAKRSILVDARELACNALKERFAGNSQVQIIQQCISSAGGKLNWYQYNLAEFSTTAEASGLKALFPGLKLQQCTEQDSTALIPFLTNLALGECTKALLLDCPAHNVELLKALLAQSAIQFEHLYITTSEQVLYEGMHSQQELEVEIQQHGYQFEAKDSTDPDLPVLHFSRNPLWQQLQAEKAQHISLKKKLEVSEHAKAEVNRQLDVVQHQAEQQKAELTKQLEQTKLQAAEQHKQSEEVKAELSKLLEVRARELSEEQAEHAATQEKLTKVQSWFESRKQQALELEQQLKIAKAELELLKKQQVTLASIQTMQSSMQTLFQQQAVQLQQATNALGKHVTRTQLEQQNNLQHFINLQHNLYHGTPILQFDGWAIQADTLNQLIKQLQQHNYDLIIEFGSGQSTLVMAKALVNQCKELKEISGVSALVSDKDKAVSIKTDIAQHYAKDLPARIVSFEQSEQFFEKTQSILLEQGLLSLVDLELAPLVPAAYANQDAFKTVPLFYDCMQKLEKLKSYLPDKEAKILVVVDGPFSPTAEPLIRYPALPAILNTFSTHKIHFVLDDSQRAGEQHVLSLWQQVCEQRGVKLSLTQWPSHKGAVVLELNP